MSNKIFKIRNKETGLFSKGGSNGHNIWTKTGKSWSNLGHIKSHLNQYILNANKSLDYPYENAEIIEVEIKYDESVKMDVNDLTDDILIAKKKEEEDYQFRLKIFKEEKERAKLARLKEKYPEF